MCFCDMNEFSDHMSLPFAACELSFSPKNKTAEALRVWFRVYSRGEQSRAIKTGERLGELSLVVRGGEAERILPPHSSVHHFAHTHTAIFFPIAILELGLHSL